MSCNFRILITIMTQLPEAMTQPISDLGQLGAPGNTCVINCAKLRQIDINLLYL